jgi:ribosome-binding protein aMBF1 (putative translation factor)
MRDFCAARARRPTGEKLFIEVAKNPVYRTPEVALLNAGVCVGSAGDVVDSERYFNRALTIKPNMPEALLQLGNLAYSRGDYKQALDDVERYLAVNPPSRSALARLSRPAQAGRQHRRRRVRPAHSDRVSRFRAGPDAARRRRSMSETAQALGQKLKAEREKRGMSAQKMADDMHLDAWVIDALEAGDYERIGPSVYAQGHLRKYASILGVSATQAAPAREAKPAGPPYPRRSFASTRPAGAAASLADGRRLRGDCAGGGRHRLVASLARRPGVGRPRRLRSPACGRSPRGRPRRRNRAATPSPVGDAGGHGVGGRRGSRGRRRGRPVAAAARRRRSRRPRAPRNLTPGVGRARLRLSFSADSRVVRVRLHG